MHRCGFPWWFSTGHPDGPCTDSNLFDLVRTEVHEPSILNETPSVQQVEGEELRFDAPLLQTCIQNGLVLKGGPPFDGIQGVGPEPRIIAPQQWEERWECGGVIEILQPPECDSALTDIRMAEAIHLRAQTDHHQPSWNEILSRRSRLMTSLNWPLITIAIRGHTGSSHDDARFIN